MTGAYLAAKGLVHTRITRVRVLGVYFPPKLCSIYSLIHPLTVTINSMCRPSAQGAPEPSLTVLMGSGPLRRKMSAS